MNKNRRPGAGFFMAVWQCASRFPPPRPAGSWALSRPLRQTLAPITPLHCPPALDARMRSSALRYSGTQVLRYSGTQVLRYSGTQVLRKAEQNHARPPRVLHSNLDLFPLPLGEGKGEGKPLYIASKRQKATRAAECALQPLCHGCSLTGAGCVRGDLSRLHDAFISP